MIPINIVKTDGPRRSDWFSRKPDTKPIQSVFILEMYLHGRLYQLLDSEQVLISIFSKRKKSFNSSMNSLQREHSFGPLESLIK